jgi:flagellar M-ring protein FliF
VLSEQKTEDRAGGPAGAAGTNGGVPGAASNIPSKQPKPQEASAAQNVQTSMTQNDQYGVNKTEIHTVMPAGRIQRVTAAILVDDAVVRTVVGGKESFKKVKRSQEELDKIQQLAEGVIGFDAKRGDTISIQNLSFDSAASAADMPVLTWNEKAQKVVTDYSSLLRPASLLLLFLLAYLFVLRPIQKHALGPGKSYATEQPILESGSASNRLAAGSNVIANDTRGALQLKDQTIELIRQKPANTARAVQAWLREEPL